MTWDTFLVAIFSCTKVRTSLKLAKIAFVHNENIVTNIASATKQNVNSQEKDALVWENVLKIKGKLKKRDLSIF